MDSNAVVPVAKEVVVHDVPAHIANSHFNFGDFFKYFMIFEELAVLFDGVHNLPVGGSVPVPAIKVEIGHGHYTLAHDAITRDS